MNVYRVRFGFYHSNGLHIFVIRTIRLDAHKLDIAVKRAMDEFDNYQFKDDYDGRILDRSCINTVSVKRIFVTGGL